MGMNIRPASSCRPDLMKRINLKKKLMKRIGPFSHTHAPINGKLTQHSKKITARSVYCGNVLRSFLMSSPDDVVV
jgi:hypothetical protein